VRGRHGLYPPLLCHETHTLAIQAICIPAVAEMRAVSGTARGQRRKTCTLRRNLPVWQAPRERVRAANRGHERSSRTSSVSRPPPLLDCYSAGAG
jgi:hypothetical protein